MIEIKNIHIAYQNEELIKDGSLSFSDGTVNVIIGKSGIVIRFSKVDSTNN